MTLNTITGFGTPIQRDGYLGQVVPALSTRGSLDSSFTFSDCEYNLYFHPATNEVTCVTSVLSFRGFFNVILIFL